MQILGNMRRNCSRSRYFIDLISQVFFLSPGFVFEDCLQASATQSSARFRTERKDRARLDKVLTVRTSNLAWDRSRSPSRVNHESGDVEIRRVSLKEHYAFVALGASLM